MFSVIHTSGNREASAPGVTSQSDFLLTSNQYFVLNNNQIPKRIVGFDFLAAKTKGRKYLNFTFSCNNSSNPVLSEYPREVIYQTWCYFLRYFRLLPPANEVGEGKVITRVRQSICQSNHRLVSNDRYLDLFKLVHLRSPQPWTRALWPLTIQAPQRCQTCSLGPHHTGTPSSP